MSFPRQPRPSSHSDSQATAQQASASNPGMIEILKKRKPARILVVDDNAGIATLMSQLLSMRGYEVWRFPRYRPPPISGLACASSESQSFQDSRPTPAAQWPVNRSVRMGAVA